MLRTGLSRHPLRSPMARPAAPRRRGEPQGSLIDQAARAIGAMDLSPEQAAHQGAASGLMFQILAPLARRDGVITTGELAKAIAAAVTAGAMTGREAATLLNRAPTEPTELKAMVWQLSRESLLAAIVLHGAEGEAATTPPSAPAGA